MPNDVSHFAIHADDCERAMTFYRNVFGWTFEPWGPPGFWLVHTGSDGIGGALHKRLEPVTGKGMIGFECSISVDDVHATEGLVEKHGGKVTMPAFTIETVGTLIKFEDTEGNVVGAMQYLPGVR
ncbi:MAG: VOC family protein [Phycisphaerae bacterium]